MMDIEIEIMKEEHFQKCVPSFSSFWGAEGRILSLMEIVNYPRIIV